MYSAGIISSRISDFGCKHYAGRIRHFRAKFEQNNRKSEALMICITSRKKNRKLITYVVYVDNFLSLLKHFNNALFCWLFLFGKILIKRITV